MNKLNLFLFLNCLDWFFSLYLFSLGAIEVNPFLSGSPIVFSMKKFALMVLIYFVGRYCLIKRDALVSWILAAANGVFLGLVLFEVYMIYQATG